MTNIEKCLEEAKRINEIIKNVKCSAAPGRGDYISRKKALEIICKHIDVEEENVKLIDVGKTFGELYFLESEEVENVIKCKNCKYFTPEQFCSNLELYGPSPEDFCSFAERKEETC